MSIRQPCLPGFDGSEREDAPVKWPDFAGEVLIGSSGDALDPFPMTLAALAFAHAFLYS